MRHLPIAASMLIFMGSLGTASASAQTLDDLNIQVHGYATQGLLYSTNNNWNSANSTDGSSAWTEAVLNVTSQPESRLRIGMQARYYLLGKYGNQITLDWASGDYKVNDRFGFRVGKVKTPLGLLNETQDVDPAYLWILLPQSIYPLASRNSTLAHYGGVAYGTVALGESLGKIEYRAFGGQRTMGSDDGSLAQFVDYGIQIPNGLAGRTVGLTLLWDTPVRGLMLGATDSSERQSGAVVYGPLHGKLDTMPFNVSHFFARYEHKKWMVAGEYSRSAPNGTIIFNGLPPLYSAVDQRGFYLMSSYKITSRLTGGLYYSSSINPKAAFTSDRYQKDWAVTGRYDFNPYLYAKFEQHFVDGTEIGYSLSNNSGGLKPNSRMTLVKLGVSF